MAEKVPYIWQKKFHIFRVVSRAFPRRCHRWHCFCHMAFSTIHASIQGVENIAGIHDCFVTTPSEMSLLRDSVRQTFADMYSVDRLSKLKAELKAQLTDNQIQTLPPEPTLGELAVLLTRSSTYFIT